MQKNLLLQYKENCGGQDIDVCCFSCWHFPPCSDLSFPLCVAEKVDKDMIDEVEEWSVEELEVVLKLVVNEWQ